MEKLPLERLCYTDSDRPVDDVDADEFGFVEIAKRLAPALIQAMGQDGLVIGIEGAWGSGKTSLINYVQQEVAHIAENSIETISLAPWLSGDDESLVETLLGRIAESVEKRDQLHGVERLKSWWRAPKKGVLPALLKKYGAKTGRAFTPVLKIGGLFIPGMSTAADITEFGSEALEALGKAPTNAQLKAVISERLKSSSGRYLVILDDLDRLEPTQAIEVIRLVKSVADFPNILYLMCYDRRVLAHALERGLGVEDGDLFLRKIVQQTFSVPLPEPFDLRINFTTHAIKHFQYANAREVTPQEAEGIKNAVSEWGRSLRTPRDVKLALNGVRFHYTPVKDEVNFSDVCRVQLMRTVEPAIYRWFEEYLGVVSVIATGDGRTGKSERHEMGQRYNELFSEEPDSPFSRWEVKKLAPGLDKMLSKNPSDLVYGHISPKQLQVFVDGKRFGSPFHYRYYFALAAARTVLPQGEFDCAMEAASQNSEKVTHILADFYVRPRSVGGNWLSQFFNRLNSFTGSEYSTVQIRNLMMGIANLMDMVLQGQELTSNQFSGPAREGETTIKHLARTLALREPDESQEAVLDVMEKGSSVTWIVGYLMRPELHRHGWREEARREPEDEWLLRTVEFERGITIVLSRVAQFSREKLIEDSPDLSSLLFGWRNLGAEAEVEAEAWVQAGLVDDIRFVDFLLRMRSWAMSNTVYFPLHRKTLACFIDVTDIDAKLEKICEEHTDIAVREKARVAIHALALAKDFA